MMATDACSLPSNFHRIHLFPESSLWMEVIQHPQLMDMVPETFPKFTLFWKYLSELRQELYTVLL